MRCNYEHLGGCTDTLTHRVEYWLGAARQRFGPYAYFCSAHAPQAAHLGLTALPRHRRRSAESLASLPRVERDRIIRMAITPTTKG